MRGFRVQVDLFRSRFAGLSGFRLVLEVERV